MPITQAQRAAADQQQLQAAQDAAPQLRLIAGPGTGKSRTIERRVGYVLAQSINAANVYVISFTRATCKELSDRVRAFCASLDPPINAQQVRVSTMHSLALRILRMGNQLTQYPDEPVMLDDWEQRNIYDFELSAELHCTPTRAGQVRLAHDAQWQTLDPQYIAQAQITQAEHADPNGIINFGQAYPQSVTHPLSDCFRCSPAVLNAASNLIVHNPQRVAKNITALYAAAEPPVNGKLHVWSFPDATSEARGIAESCEALINTGMAGREDEIVILISSRHIQLPLLAQELGNRGIPFDEPVAGGLADNDSIRAVLCLLRLVEEKEENASDYVAYRALVALCSGVGVRSAKQLADWCVAHAQNFRALFHAPALPVWLVRRPRTAVNNVRALLQSIAAWSLQDTLDVRRDEISDVIMQDIFTSAADSQAFTDSWTALAGSLPGGMTLEELLLFLRSTSERDRETVLNSVNSRLGENEQIELPVVPKRVRILTMHGAKGLSGKVAFIPSVEQGILPSFRNLQAAGLVIEHRRLFYVSITRAMAACIISHAALHSGAQAFALRPRFQVRLPRSQFLNEIGTPSVNRVAGLTNAEAEEIVADVVNL